MLSQWNAISHLWNLMTTVQHFYLDQENQRLGWAMKHMSGSKGHEKEGHCLLLNLDIKNELIIRSYGFNAGITVWEHVTLWLQYMLHCLWCLQNDWHQLTQLKIWQPWKWLIYSHILASCTDGTQEIDPQFISFFLSHNIF